MYRLIYTLTILLLSSCSSLSSGLFSGSPVMSRSDHESSKDDVILNDPDAARARYLFLESELNAAQESPEENLLKLEEANRLTQEKSPTILKKLCQVYIRLGKLQEASLVADKALLLSPDSLELLKLKASTLAASSRITEAVDVYEQIIVKSEKDDEEPYLLLSGLFLQQGKSDKAIEVLTRLSHKNKNSFIARYYLGKLYASVGNYSKAKVVLEEALLINQSEQIEYDYIKVLALNKEVDKALARAKSLVDKNPQSAKGRELLGELLLGSQKVNQALQVFEEAKNLGEDPVSLRFKVALLKLQNRDYIGAESELALLVSQHPTNYEARYYLATALASQDKIKEAIVELKSIPKTHSLHKRSYGFAAYLLRQTGDTNGALNLIQEALEEDPRDIELLGYKASILKDFSEKDDSKSSELIVTLNEMIAVQPENDQFLFNLATALDENGQRAEAKKKIEEAISKNPKNVNALNYLGYTLAEEGEDLQRAEQLIVKALELEPDNGYFLDSLGWVYYKRGEYLKAEVELRKAVEKVPTDGVILEHLGRILLKLGKKEEAIQILKKALQHLELDDKLKDEAKQVSDLLSELE